jgi:hypothetical protein
MIGRALAALFLAVTLVSGVCGQSAAPEERDPLVRLQGSAAFASAPTAHARIAALLLDVRQGRLDAPGFYRGLGEIGAGMSEVREVRTRLEQAGVVDTFLGPRHAEGGSLVERVLLVHRREATERAIAGAGRTVSHDSGAFVARVGRWATQSPNALTFDSDIDFSFVSADTRVSAALKAAFDEGFRRELGVEANAKGADVLATVHGRAAMEVYIGAAGQAFAEKGMVDVSILGRDGGLRAVSRERMDNQIAFERDFVAADTRLPQATRQAEPGLSFEMARHFVHDIQGSAQYGPATAVIKAAKYLDRSMSASGGGGDPGLSGLAREITALSSSHRSAELYDLLASRLGSGGMQGGGPGATEAARFQGRVAAAIWANVTAGITRELGGIEERLKAAEGLTGPERLSALAEIRSRFIPLFDTVAAEMEALRAQNVTPPVSVRQAVAHVEEMQRGLGRLGFAVTDQDLKEKRYVEELIRADTPASRRLAIGHIALKISRGVETANGFLDILDTKLLGGLRGEGDFDALILDVRDARRGLGSTDPIERAAARRRADAAAARSGNVVARANREINQIIQSSTTGRNLVKGLVVFGLAEETSAYVEAFHRDGWNALATEFFRRRVPFGSTVERAIMGDYAMAGWDAVTTLLPPLALPQAAAGILQTVYDTGTELYWTEELNLFVDGLYASARFAPVAARREGQGLVGDWRLQSVSLDGRIHSDFEAFRKTRQEQVAAMTADLRKPQKDRFLYSKLFAYHSGVIDGRKVDEILRRNIAAVDPFLGLYREMARRKDVGEALALHMRQQEMVRWEQVKLAYLFELVEKLEARWQQEWAANAGQIPALIDELRRLTRELEIANRVWETLEREAARSHWQDLIAWMIELKRDMMAEPSAVSHMQEAAGLVIRYLETYREVLRLRTMIEERLDIVGQRRGGMRLLTGPLLLRGEPEIDLQAAGELMKLFETQAQTVNRDLVERKARLTDHPVEHVTLDDGFDASMKSRLLTLRVWRASWAPFLMADGPPMAGMEPAHEVRLGLIREQDAAIEAFEAHYRRSGVLLVSVLDAATGRPVSGARVSLSGTSSQRERTGADGKARFAGLPRGAYDVAAEMTGYTVTRRERLAFPSPGEERQERMITLRLQPATAGPDLTPPGMTSTSAITVTVLDRPSGKPVGGASVRLEGQDGAGRSAVTGVDGKAGFSQLADGTYSLRVLHPGHVGQTRERLVLPSPTAEPGKPETRAFTMRLEPVLVSHLAVAVTDAASGAPLPGAVVTLGTPLGPRRLTTGEDGRLTIRDLPAGDYRLTVTAAAHAPASRVVTLPPELRAGEEIATARVSMALQPARLSTLVVTLRDADTGQPIGGGEVAVTGAGLRFARTTGGNGVARIEGIPPGTFAVSASAKGHERRGLGDIRMPVGDEGPSLRQVALTLKTMAAETPSSGGRQAGATPENAPPVSGTASGGEPDGTVVPQICSAFGKLVTGGRRPSGAWFLEQYRNVRNIAVGHRRLMSNGQPTDVCIVRFDGDYLIRGEWRHMQNLDSQVAISDALKDVEQQDPAMGKALRSRYMAPASGAPGIGATQPVGDPCAGLRGTPRPNSVDGKVILKWVRCNGHALSLDQIRLLNRPRAE